MLLINKHEPIPFSNVAMSVVVVVVIIIIVIVTVVIVINGILYMYIYVANGKYIKSNFSFC